VSALDGGSTVGRYRILGFLGAGAMGEVYLAEDPHIGRKLAIKTVRLVGRPAEIEDRKKRLLREARAAGRLLHPHIVALFDAGEAEGLLYLVFELVEGIDLAGRLEQGPPLTLREVLRIVRQVAEAIDYAHQQGIVHRDIKPSNILIDNAGRVKVADFGIAKMSGQSTELTVAGSVMGSPQYLSPEQIRGEDLDGRSDIFSLGVVVYELLSGKRPFDGETITTLVYQILHKEPPSVSELRSIPPRFDTLLRRMLAKDRADRIPTGGQVAEELAAIERELDDATLAAPAAGSADALTATHVLPRRHTEAALPPPPPAPPVYSVPVAAVPPPAAPVAPPPARDRRWLLVALVLGVLVAAVAGGGFLLWRARSASQAAETAEEVAALPGTPAPGTTPASAPGTETPPLAVSPAPVVPSPPTTMPMPTPTPALRAGGAAMPTPPPAATPTVPRREPTPPPAAVPGPAPAPAPAPSRPAEETKPAAPAETDATAPEESSELDARDVRGADQVIHSGLNLAFRVSPADAFISIDRTQIGMAKEWSGQKGARTYDLAGPGQYRIRLRKPGMRDYHIAVEASSTRGTTTIVAQMKPLPAADVDASDLPVFRVRDGVAFRLRPPAPAAVVLVDGTPVGPARQYTGGGFLGGGGWLKLDPGRHRISVTAPGRRQDFIVEVNPGAPKERERIDVDLSPGGNP
jgi:serine/threonine-protein kinase